MHWKYIEEKSPGGMVKVTPCILVHDLRQVKWYPTEKWQLAHMMQGGIVYVPHLLSWVGLNRARVDCPTCMAGFPGR